MRGWDEVANSSDLAASLARDGEFSGAEIIERYFTAGLAYVVEIERAKAKIGRSEDITPLILGLR